MARLAITFIGHASLLLQAADLNILIDPVWSVRASPVRFAGPKRVNQPGVDFDALPPIDVVLITHSHYDHLDASTLKRLWRRDRPRIITALGTDAVIKRAVPDCEAEAGDWGDKFCISDRVSATLHPANHWSARTVGDRRRALWCGFVIQVDREVIYVAGDTGYGDGRIFRHVRERFRPPSIAVLPIGAYEPRWFMTAQHVNPDEAVRILLDCGAAQGLGGHWGTFQLTDEKRLAPVDGPREACARHRIQASRFVPLQPGDVWGDG